MQQKEIKGTQIGKKEVKLNLFTDVILYIEKPKESIKNLFELINELAMLQDTKINWIFM